MRSRASTMWRTLAVSASGPPSAGDPPIPRKRSNDMRPPCNQTPRRDKRASRRALCRRLVPGLHRPHGDLRVPQPVPARKILDDGRVRWAVLDETDRELMEIHADQTAFAFTPLAAEVQGTAPGSDKRPASWPRTAHSIVDGIY